MDPRRKSKFTDKFIRSIAFAGKRTEYYDALPPLPGQAGQLGLRVGASSKTWIVRYRTAGKRRRLTLGQYPAVTLKQARILAGKNLADVYSGADPALDVQQRKAAPTMNDLWVAYQDAMAMRKETKAPATLKEEHRKWKKVIQPAIGDTKVRDVTPEILSELLDQLARTSPVSANRLYSLIQVMFKPALKKGWITVHPLQWIDKPGGSEPARRRVLDNQEIKAVWPYLDQLQPNPRDILKLGLLTVQRPGELMSMRWSDIDLDLALWNNRDTKTGNDHMVPLSDQVLELLKARQAGTGYTKKQSWMVKSEFVFPSKYNVAKGAMSSHTKSTKDARRKVKELSGVENWTAHDLRRTARTIMSRLQIKQHVRERVLNHSQGGVVGVYDQHDYLPEKADALQKLADELCRITGERAPAGKVVKLRVA